MNLSKNKKYRHSTFRAPIENHNTINSIITLYKVLREFQRHPAIRDTSRHTSYMRGYLEGIRSMLPLNSPEDNDLEFLIHNLILN